MTIRPVTLSRVKHLSIALIASGLLLGGSAVVADGKTPAVPVAATAATPPKPKPMSADQINAIGARIDDLKQQVIALSGSVEDLRDQVAYPPTERLSVFMSVGFSTLLLHEITVVIDGGQPIHHIYSSTESRALRSGLQRLADLNLADGAHQVHAEYVAYNEDYQLFEAPIKGSLDSSFDKSADVRTLELTITGTTPISASGTPGAPVTQLGLKTWSQQ